jgi:uncharacterized membrane protein YedE/YeeE
VKVLLAALGCGVFFGAGLALSGMVQPTKILSFLDVAGTFDPSLLVMMVSALAVLVPAQVIARRRGSVGFGVVPRAPVDGRLVLGSGIFGLGWGLSGFCPGPSIAAAGAGVKDALWFVAAMVAGMLLFRAFEALQRKREADETGVPAHGQPAA